MSTPVTRGITPCQASSGESAADRSKPGLRRGSSDSSCPRLCVCGLAIGQQRECAQQEGSSMKPLALALLVMVGNLLMLSDSARAQSVTSGAIAGVVKDVTGAVLPGVTVEAASPALIEKVRTVVTDDQGNYKIFDLRPG